jgi:hypothetical protein
MLSAKLKRTLIEKLGLPASTKIKPIRGIDGYYITACGKVISTRGKEPAILAHFLTADGHHQVGLYTRTRKRRRLYVHRLVLEHFGPPHPYPKALALHRDDDKDNNVLSNLRWGSRAQNVADAKRNGLTGQPVLSQEQVQKIKLVVGLLSHKCLARLVGAPHRSVSNVARGKTHTDVPFPEIPEDGALVVRIA